MKRKGICLRIRLHWLALLFLSDLFFTFLVWLANPSALKSLVLIIILFTLLITAAGYAVDWIKIRVRLKALEDFLKRQGEYEEHELLAVTDKVWHASINEAALLLSKERTQNSQKQQELLSYREFIEEWTHEIKTPLSLSELVLENHREEMSDYVYRRIRHVQRMVEMDVDRILYYARLSAEHVDYKFEKLFLPRCAKEALVKYTGIAEEKEVKIIVNVAPVWVVSDWRVLSFMLSQILGNAFKYTKKNGGFVEIDGWKDEGEGKVYLAVRDNGEGAPAEDIPFLFDKGFTGSHPSRQKASGMGLYFVKKYAEVLAADVRVEEELFPDGKFGIRLEFPE